MSDELPVLSQAEARVLGCLAEKKALTPDIYPLTENAALAAANQKTAREPVMALEVADIRRAFVTLEQKGLVRRSFASRVERYEHLLAQKFSLTSAQIALLGIMMLRGPQTAHELLARSERMARFQSVDDVKSDLDLLIGRRPALAQLIERGPGQREERYAHMLGGPVHAPAPRTAAQVGAPVETSDFEERIEALERQVALLTERLKSLAPE